MKTIQKIKTPVLILLSFLFSQFIIAGGKDEANTIKYRITAVKKNDSGITSESNVIEVNVPLAIYIPNAFTPNGDGLNDSFGVEGEGIAEFNMSIFNKWGELIFETKNLQEQWNGTFGGEIVQDGAYVYNINLRTTDKKSLVKSGTITVLK